MDFEMVLPRTCTLCRGTGQLYYGDTDDYDVQPCDQCNETEKVK